MTTHVNGPEPASVTLYWLPLGAGDAPHCVRWGGRTFEVLMAGCEHRERCDLYHSALEVQLNGARFAIEMAPVWRDKVVDRGVVCEGPVGFPGLGHSRYFRYEVQCWRDGHIPDIAEAVEGPQLLSQDKDMAQRVLESAAAFPAATWGRDELRTGEMWNSNF